MFKKDITAGAKTKVKSSVQRAIRQKVLEAYPRLAPHIDEIIPKKAQLDLVKLPDRVSLYALDSFPVFFQHMDDPLTPTLRLVHRYPWAFRAVRIDRGAIRFVLSGATLMVPGLTSKGGWLPGGKGEGEGEKKEGPGGGVEGDDGDEAEIAAGEVVAVRAEGKEEVCLVGVLKMGTEEMKRVGKGVAMEGGHYLGDGLWRMKMD